ncbi:hypothetical protein CLU79DRAFT_831528 [Phycomyces nitens]|nr:hypothetical protein CLU79DRAFT_831528 [Phycomyces nitens]
MKFTAMKRYNKHCQRETSIKRERQTPSDASWCLEDVATLSLESFALHFGLTNKVKTLARYRNIVNKWIDDDIVKENLLDDLDRWSITVNFVAFWQERARTATIAKSRSACSSFVDNLIVATMTRFIDNNDSFPTLDRIVKNEIPTTPWILGNTNITDLFQQYRRHVDNIDLPLSS